MTQETREVLSRVVSKAAKLKASSFLAEIERGGWKANFSGPEITITRPHDEAIESFVLNLRFFILGNEATSFQALARLEGSPELSERWATQFRAPRSAVNDHLATAYGEYHYGGRKKQFSNREIMDTFLNSGLLHANDRHAVERMKEWSSSPGLLALLEFWFVSTMRTLCEAIFFLSAMCERELRRASDAQ